MSNHNFEATPTVKGTNVEWKLCYLNKGQCGDGKATPYPNVELDKNSGQAHFIFIISKPSGIVFAPDPIGSIWVHKKGHGNGPGVHSQITDVQGAGTTQLTFTDENDRPSFFHPKSITLKYQLNFVDAQKKSVTSLDPDIKNGGKTLFAVSNAVAAGIGAALAIIVLVAWWSNVRADRRGPAGGPGGAGGNPGG